MRYAKITHTTVLQCCIALHTFTYGRRRLDARRLIGCSIVSIVSAISIYQ